MWEGVMMRKEPKTPSLGFEREHWYGLEKRLLEIRFDNGVLVFVEPSGASGQKIGAWSVLMYPPNRIIIGQKSPHHNVDDLLIAKCVIQEFVDRYPER